MKLINSSIVFAAVILISGCSKSAYFAETPRDACEVFIKYSAARDFDRIKSMVHPELLTYYKERGIERFPELFVFSIAGSIPDEADTIAITRFKVMSPDEITRSFEDNYFYKRVPDAFRDLVEVKFSYRSGDRHEGSIAMFMKEYRSSFYIVVPDLSDSAVWKQHLE